MARIIVLWNLPYPKCGMKIKFHPIDGQMPPFRRHLVHIHEQSIILVSG